MKLKQFQSYLKKQKIDLAILNESDVNTTYFTQIKPSYSLLLIGQRTANLYLTKLDKIPDLKEFKVKVLEKGWEKKLNKNVKRIGLNYASVTMNGSRRIKRLFPKAKFSDISKQLNKLRTTKTEQECKCINQACKITDYAFSEMLKNIRKLKTEQQVADFIDRKFKEKGAESAFPTIVAMGKNAAVPHHLTSNQKLKRGFLLLDFGAKYKYYCADMSRTIFLGTPKKQEIEMYNLLLNAQEQAIKESSQVKTFFELDQLVRKQLGKYSSHFIHSLGHGLGLEIHESPSDIKESKQEIKPGHVFTIEPGVYFPGKFGIRIEDTVIYNDKVKVLTKSKKELVCVKI